LALAADCSARDFQQMENTMIFQSMVDMSQEKVIEEEKKKH
jgi:hypothetical protein